jgi:hypothetical protein
MEQMGAPFKPSIGDPDNQREHAVQGDHGGLVQMPQDRPALLTSHRHSLGHHDLTGLAQAVLIVRGNG